MHFNPDGSVVIVVDGERIEVFEPSGAKRFSARLAAELQGATPDVSPDGCAAALRVDKPTVGIQVIDLGCFQGTAPRFFEGRDAAWSPDSTAIAVAAPDAIVVHKLVGGNLRAVWPTHAIRLVWRDR